MGYIGFAGETLGSSLFGIGGPLALTATGSPPKLGQQLTGPNTWRGQPRSRVSRETSHLHKGYLTPRGSTGGIPTPYAGVARHAALYRERVPTGRGGAPTPVFHVKHAGVACTGYNPYIGAVNEGGIWYLRPPGLFWTAA